VHGRLPVHGDPDERRLERETDDCADRQAESFARGVDGEYRDPRGEAA
jgi:hypothetical protein